MDVLMPLCFVVFFGSIFPLSILLFLAMLLMQVRCDAWKLTHVFRRPYPRLGHGLSGLRSFLNFCGYTMIITNLASMFLEFDSMMPLPHWFIFHRDVEAAKIGGMAVKAGWLADALWFCVASLALVLL